VKFNIQGKLLASAQSTSRNIDKQRSKNLTASSQVIEKHAINER